MYISVTPFEMHLDGNDTEINLDDSMIIGFEVNNLGAANLTLFNFTVLTTDDCWESPANYLGIPIRGRIPIKWGSGTKSAVVYALRGNFEK